MKKLVIYYSRSGNTQTVAEQIRKILTADIVKIREEKSRKGAIQFILAAFEALTNQTANLKPLNRNLSEYDLVVIGSPVWAGRLSTPIRTFLLQRRSSVQKAAFFYTYGGRAGKIEQQVQNLLGDKLLETAGVKEAEIEPHGLPKNVKRLVDRSLEAEGSP